MKRFLALFLILTVILSLAACSKNDDKSQTEKPTENQEVVGQTSKPDVDETPTEDDESRPSDEILAGSIKLTDIEEDTFDSVQGKVKQILETKSWFALYADSAIYHTDRDDNSEYYLHEFAIGDVDEIVFYQWKASNIMMSYVSNEICAYTIDENLYISMTAPSENIKHSEAYTFKAPCSKDNFIYADREVETAFVIFEQDGATICYEYNCELDEVVAQGELFGDYNGELIKIKSIESNEFNKFAFDFNNVGYALASFYEFERQADGSYVVELHDEYVIDGVSHVYSSAFDDAFIKADDSKNINICRLNGDGMQHNWVALPEGKTLDNIVDSWAGDEYCVFLFDDDKYYNVEAPDSFSNNKCEEMEVLNIVAPEGLEIVGFGYDSFELVVLLSDGTMHVCEDVL